MYFESLMNNYQTYLLVFARVAGIFIYNPIFSRKNIPTRVKIGASAALTLIIAMPFVNEFNVEYASVGILALAFIKEGFVGFILGFITQMFLSGLLVGGVLMDNQSGLGMANIYDPSSGVQMPIFGTVTTYMFMVYFFVTDSHLTYIKIFSISYELLPLNFSSLNPNVFMVIVQYFTQILILSIKLALPIVVAELILEFCMGVLMKVVPQIQVMQVNIQLKLLFGLFILFITANPMSNFIEKYITTLMDSLVGVLPIIAG